MLHELIVAKEMGILVKRSPAKYAGFVAGMYGLSFYGQRMASDFRYAYSLVRKVDDVLDGDRKITGDPLGYAEDIRNQIETGNFKKNWDINRLAERVVLNLEKKAKLDDNPRQDFVNAIDACIFDYKRAQRRRRTLTEQEIEGYYKAAFDPVVNLMLIGINSSLRVKDVPAMSYGQGRVYSIDDLETDWERGVLNIPKEQLKNAGLTSGDSIKKVRNSPVIQEWIKTTFQKTKSDLITTQKRISGSEEKLTTLICNGIINPLIRTIDSVVS